MKRFDVTWEGQFARWAMAAVMVLAGVLPVAAAENVPRKPFAQWANLPAAGQFVVTPWYMEAEAYRIWRGEKRENITVHLDDEPYGIDYMQGVIALEYGIAPKWAADLEVGFTTVGTRSFNPTAESESTLGLMDTSFGVRYQICNEAGAQSPWVPTLTFRAGAVVPGTFDKNFPFAPGDRSAAIEPSFLLRKHFGWQGLGGYGDVLYRWMRTSGVDQYIAAVGLFQEIKGWTLSGGYRHLQCTSGVDIGGSGTTITYSPEVREISDSVQAGFSYTTSRRKINYEFNIMKTFNGRNTSSAFWLGAFVDIPFGGR